MDIDLIRRKALCRRTDSIPPYFTHKVGRCINKRIHLL